MNFMNTVKVFEINVLRQAGVTISPSQLGLKSDPVADLQAQSGFSAFGSVLNKLTGNSTMSSSAMSTYYTPPNPPTPPTDLTDNAAMLKYQQEMLTYNQSYQAYNQRMMQLMLRQMQQMQQSAMQAQSASSSNTSSSSSSDGLGIGGIL